MTQLIAHARSGAWRAAPTRPSRPRGRRLASGMASGALLAGLWLAGSALWRAHPLFSGSALAAELGPLVSDTVVDPLLSGQEVRFGALLDRAARRLIPAQAQPVAYPQDRMPALPAVHPPARAAPVRQVRGDFVPGLTDAV